MKRAPKTARKPAKQPAAAQSGRNPDGTFNSFQQPQRGGGRPPELLSFRHQLKLRLSKNPELVQQALDTLMSIANDPKHPKCIDAADKLIKLNGNYDPTETRDVSARPVERPLKNLDLSELRKLLARVK